MSSSKILLLLALITLATSISGQCDGTAEASPIDITTTNAQYCTSSEFTYFEFTCYEKADYTFQDGTTTGEVQFLDTIAFAMIDYIQDDGQSARAIARGNAINFHAPSQHTIKGVSYPLEMRIVLDTQDVSAWADIIDQTNVDLFTSQSKDNLKSTFSTAGDNTPPHIYVSFLFEASEDQDDTDFFHVDDRTINLKNMLDCMADRFFYRYRGTTTVSECHVAEWLVAREPIKITQGSIDKIKAQISATSAPTVALGQNRVIRLSGIPCYPNTD